MVLFERRNSNVKNRKCKKQKRRNSNVKNKKDYFGIFGTSYAYFDFFIV
jgi:hypothetical protein